MVQVTWCLHPLNTALALNQRLLGTQRHARVVQTRAYVHQSQRDQTQVTNHSHWDSLAVVDVPIIAQRLERVRYKVLVLSGKGGVGKSTFSAQLAFALAQDENTQVGLMDIDICGPSIPRLLGLEGEQVHQTASGWSPVYVEENLGVMSVGFMLQDPSEAVIWRGPKKNGLIKQFLRDVDWGELDYLVVDTPPGNAVMCIVLKVSGTSDEHLSIVQYLKEAKITGAVVVTTPQEVALMDVRKEINFCKKVGVPVIGVVENMSGFVCPKCSVRSLKGVGSLSILSERISNLCSNNRRS